MRCGREAWLAGCVHFEILLLCESWHARVCCRLIMYPGHAGPTLPAFCAAPVLCFFCAATIALTGNPTATSRPIRSSEGSCALLTHLRGLPRVPQFCHHRCTPLAFFPRHVCCDWPFAHP